MLILASIGMKYLYVADWVYYVILVAAALIVLILSPVEDKNKPLDKAEHKIYKRRAALIAALKLVVCIGFNLIGLDNLFVAVAYSFATLSFMLIAGRIKNRLGSSKML